MPLEVVQNIRLTNGSRKNSIEAIKTSEFRLAIISHS